MLAPAEEFSEILKDGWHRLTCIILNLTMVGVFYSMEIKLQKCYRLGTPPPPSLPGVLVVKCFLAQDQSEAIGDKILMRASWFPPGSMLILTCFIPNA